MADPKGKTPSERIKMQHQHGRKVMGMRDKQKSGGGGKKPPDEDSCAILAISVVLSGIVEEVIRHGFFQ